MAMQTWADGPDAGGLVADGEVGLCAVLGELARHLNLEQGIV